MDHTKDHIDTTTPASVHDHAATDTTSSKSGNLGEQVGRGIRGVFTGIHGAGESLRGGINSAVDTAFGSREGVEKDEAIADKGEREMKEGGTWLGKK